MYWGADPGMGPLLTVSFQLVCGHCASLSLCLAFCKMGSMLPGRVELSGHQGELLKSDGYSLGSREGHIPNSSHLC